LASIGFIENLSTFATINKPRLDMKKLFLIAFLAMALMAKAQTITIGEGNGMTDVVPYNTFYNYSFTEQIFLASEIEYAGTIKAVSFRIAYSYNTEYTSDIVVYLKNVSRSTFEDPADYEPVTEEDIVFTGTWTIPADYDGWITIEFDTPFAYNGTDNLLIALDENSADYAIRYFRYTDTPNTVLSYCSDIWNLNPYDLGSFVGPKEVSHYRGNIKLVFGGNVGLDEDNMNLLLVYPNPAKDMLHINGVDNEMVSVYDDSGRLVMQEICNGQLDINNLESGLYAICTSKGVVKVVKH